MYEVELKFRVPDPAVLERRLAALGVDCSAAVEQVDRYLAHPVRDFALTDEALRLRRVGDAVVITWKGPRIDQATKTRREIELDLAPVTAGSDAGRATIARWTELLESLGFTRVREVVKQRRTAVVRHAGGDVEVALDTVAGLGTFLELEQRVPEGDVPAARNRIESLARDLGCTAPERRSYLELLLEGG